jgi:magnesium transporter
MQDDLLEATGRGPVSAAELADAWPVLPPEDRLEGFLLLPRSEADEFFLGLNARDQGDLLLRLSPAERRTWMRLLAPDDAADVLQEVGPERRPELLALLDEPTRKEVTVLLAYAEDDAGGLMSPRFARVRPDMTVDEAISYLRKQKRERVETLYYAYVLDAQQRLLGVVSLRDLFLAAPDTRVSEVMRTDLVTVPEEMDQEAVSRLFSEHDLLALPVVNREGTMVGIVTVDDIVDVVQEEATEDILKVGGMQALDAPYFETSFGSMLRKRVGWLTILFVSQMLTATAMAHFAEEIAQAVVLAVFLPLIISSGGNSGSQASTLIVRAMALGEVRLRDWWRVLWREVSAGAALGVFLGAIGLARILAWQGLFDSYGEHFVLIGFTVALSLMGVVAWGTVSGSMLPFVLRRLGFDPASASAPFVATLVDVTGVVLYFSIAALILRGSML